MAMSSCVRSGVELSCQLAGRPTHDLEFHAVRLQVQLSETSWPLTRLVLGSAEGVRQVSRRPYGDMTLAPSENYNISSAKAVPPPVP